MRKALPPRSTVHGKRKKTTQKRKFRFPLVKILFLTFLAVVFSLIVFLVAQEFNLHLPGF